MAEPARGQRRATIRDVARAAGVSIRSVTRVTAQLPSVSEEMRARVEAAIAEFGYVPDSQAKGLAHGRSHLIGLLYDNPNPTYFMDIQWGISEGLRGTGYEVVIRAGAQSSATLLDDIRAFVRRIKLAGLVLTPPLSEDPRVAALLQDENCPYVRIASRTLDAPERMIVSCDRAGALDAGRHLVHLGHRRIGHISGPPNFASSTERREGLLQALAEAKAPPDAALFLEGAYTFESGLARGAELLRLERPPTAIFAGNDEMAAGVLMAARRAGLDVPGDLSVVGFDDLAAAVSPPLTTVRMPTRQFGRLAARKLLDDQAAASLGPRCGAAPRLIVRASSGPAPRRP